MIRRSVPVQESLCGFLDFSIDKFLDIFLKSQYTDSHPIYRGRKRFVKQSCGLFTARSRRQSVRVRVMESCTKKKVIRPRMTSHFRAAGETRTQAIACVVCLLRSPPVRHTPDSPSGAVRVRVRGSYKKEGHPSLDDLSFLCGWRDSNSHRKTPTTPSK